MPASTSPPVTESLRPETTAGLSDLAGLCLSGVCLVHCTLLPLVVSLSPVLIGNLLDDRWFHLWLLLLILPLAVIAFAVGWRRHRSLATLLFGSLGLVGLVLAAVFGHDLLGTTGEKILTSASGVLLALGHFINFRLRRSRLADRKHFDGTA